MADDDNHRIRCEVRQDPVEIAGAPCLVVGALHGPHPRHSLHTPVVAADEFHRDHATVELAIRDLESDLVDTMHVAVAPVELGRGERLWTAPEKLLDRFHLETVPRPSRVTHHLLWRR